MRIIYVPRSIVPANSKYGLLYNGFAANDARNLAGVGFHIPTIYEFQTLQTYISNNGFGMMEIGSMYWASPSSGTNIYGFNGRGSGVRGYSPSTYSLITLNCFFWTTSGISGQHSVSKLTNYANELYVNPAAWVNDKSGYSIRPIKDSTTLSDGETGFYVDPSGYVYRTICIGTQEWVADNIKTQHYRNGDAIPEVTDNAAWAALTTGALCSYNNDWSNV